MKKMKFYLIVGIVFLISCSRTQPTKFTLINQGQQVIDSVYVMVNHNTYIMRSVGIGEEKEIDINFNDESNIRVSINGGSDITLDVYFEPNYGGEVEAGVTADTVNYYTFDNGWITGSGN